MQQHTQTAWWRRLAAAIVVLLAYCQWQDWHLTGGVRNHNVHALALAAGLAVVALAVLFWAAFPRQADAVLARLLRWRGALRQARWLVLAAVVVAFPALVLFIAPFTEKFAPWPVRVLGYLVTAAVAAFLLAGEDAREITFADGLRGLLLTSATFAFLSAYTQVSAYPFGLTWSEGNRLWDYSVLFARDRYVYPPDQPVFAYIDLGRQFLWGLIYLVPRVNIFWVRWWSAFLFTVPYLLFAWAAFLEPRRARGLVFWAGLWGFLFLYQGPIYTPLLLSALALVLAEMALPWWAGLPLVAAATYYAAATRFTWVVAPLLWSVVLVAGRVSGGWKAALRQRGWWLAAGSVAGALLSGRVASLWAIGWGVVARQLLGKPAEAAASGALTTRQPLIWARLWPNPTFAPGIVLGVLLAVAPVALLWWVWRRKEAWQLPRWALVSVGGVLAALLGGGVLISLKIGGGSNLHNLDMFLVAVVLTTVVLWRQGGFAALQGWQQWRVWERGVLVALVVVPMYFVLLAAQPRSIPDAKWWQPALQAVRHYVHEANAQGKDVLFMDQRQLLTFGAVEPTPLVVEYEKKYMMDKAMAGDSAYFAQYYRDLAMHRFGVIITEPLHINYQPAEGNDFAAENNAWVRWVSVPTLCYYRIAAVFPAAGVEILVPRDEDDHLRCEQALPTK